MTELETALDQMRRAAQSATGALASLFVAPGPDTSNAAPSILLGLSSAQARYLYDPARRFMRNCAPQANGATVFPNAARHQLEPLNDSGRETILLLLAVEGPENDTTGCLALMFDLADWQDDRTIAACHDLAEGMRVLWRAQDNVSGLAYELMTLSSRATRLQRLSETDALTQLNNRASFENKVRTRLEEPDLTAAFMIIDIDHFKLINDVYGHQFGDRYLKTVARSLSNSFPETSIIGRLGGDEFGILTPLPAAGRAYLDGLLSRCRSNIQRAITTLKKPDLGYVSIGASQFPKDASSYSKLYELSDNALYAAKNAGRGMSSIYHPHHHIRYNTSELSQRFHGAAASGEIHPNFQPIVDLATGETTGFEVLARWRDQDGNNMAASQFSAIFRDHALAEKMTRTIMEQAFAIHGQPGTGKPQPSLNLNVTFFDLMNPEFVFDVQSLAKETNFDLARLTIEVTEQIMLDEPNGQIFRTLREFRARGARIALDDFGTGYGGLRHLADWPIDMLKVDKFFVDGLVTGDRSCAVLEAIVAMAAKMDLTIIAEGIETLSQARLLKSMGCRYGQGFLFDAPMDGQAIENREKHYAV